MTETSSARDSPKVPESDIAKVADRLRAFISANGGGGSAVISYLGRRGARIVVVSDAGPFCDAVVPDMDQAAAACEAAGVTVAEWDRQLTGKITVSAADRRRMAGTGR